MPTLNWIGKDAVVNHHREAPYHLLRCDSKLSVGDPGSGNLLVQGDNLLALKALLPYYAGQVKCIYIDPPYNTGNENWVYNDNVNSPEIRKWLGRVVGKEAEDLSRHDKWLCMMYPRLALLREFLREDGAIFVSIDDNEVQNLRLIMDAIFGEHNFITSIPWVKRVSPANDAKYLSSDHEFILLYARNKSVWRPNRLDRTEEQLKNYRNPDNDPRGPWNSSTCTCNKSRDERPNLYHGIKNPNTGETVFPRTTAVWKFDPSAGEKYAKENRFYWGVKGNAKMPRLKTFLSEVSGVVPRSFFHYSDCGHTQGARTEILSILHECPFATPKPTRLLQRILQIAAEEGSIVLDSFAGSGTAGHAVLMANKADGGARRFIMVEMEEDICRNVTAQRLTKAVEGYTTTNGSKDKDISGLGGGFRYCTLSHPIFDENGQIHDEVRFADLAAHVFFTETGEPIPKRSSGKTPLIGVCNGVAVYLLFNGVLGDKRVNGGNVLTSKVLGALPAHDGLKVVYGEGCRLGASRLKREGVTFKQVPYEIKTT